MQIHAEFSLDLVTQVDPSPADDTVDVQVGPLLDKGRELHLLRVRQLRHRAGRLEIVETRQSVGIVPVNPVPQRLAIHPTLARRRGPVHTFEHQRQRQHATSRPNAARTTRRNPQVRGRQIKTTDRNRMSHDRPTQPQNHRSERKISRKNAASQPQRPLVLALRSHATTLKRVRDTQRRATPRCQPVEMDASRSALNISGAMAGFAGLIYAVRRDAAPPLTGHIVQAGPETSRRGRRLGDRHGARAAPVLENGIWTTFAACRAIHPLEVSARRAMTTDGFAMLREDRSPWLDAGVRSDVLGWPERTAEAGSRFAVGRHGRGRHGPPEGRSSQSLSMYRTCAWMPFGIAAEFLPVSS